MYDSFSNMLVKEVSPENNSNGISVSRFAFRSLQRYNCESINGKYMEVRTIDCYYELT